MMNLVEKIDRAIEERALKTGAMGSESVDVAIQLTEEEKEIFKTIDKYDNEHYFWSFDDDNTLSISYREEV